MRSTSAVLMSTHAVSAGTISGVTGDSPDCACACEPGIGLGPISSGRQPKPALADCQRKRAEDARRRLTRAYFWRKLYRMSCDFCSTRNRGGKGGLEPNSNTEWRHYHALSN